MIQSSIWSKKSIWPQKIKWSKNSIWSKSQFDPKNFIWSKIQVYQTVPSYFWIRNIFLEKFVRLKFWICIQCDFPTERWVLVENCISTALMMITSSSVQRVVQNHDGHHNTARHFLTQPQKNFSVLKGSLPAHKSTFTCKSGVNKNSCHYKDLLQFSVIWKLGQKCWKKYFDSKFPIFGSNWILKIGAKMLKKKNILTQNLQFLDQIGFWKLGQKCWEKKIYFDSKLPILEQIGFLKWAKKIGSNFWINMNHSSKWSKQVLNDPKRFKMIQISSK